MGPSLEKKEEEREEEVVMAMAAAAAAAAATKWLMLGFQDTEITVILRGGCANSACQANPGLCATHMIYEWEPRPTGQYSVIPKYHCKGQGVILHPVLFIGHSNFLGQTPTETEKQSRSVKRCCPSSQKRLSPSLGIWARTTFEQQNVTE